MKVHLFGAASSSGCANYGLKHLAMEINESYPLGSQYIIKIFYVDDGLISVRSEDDDIKVVEEARRLCALGGLRLHKFISNSKAVLASIPASEKTSDIERINLSFGELPLEKTIGLQWKGNLTTLNSKLI